MGPFMSPATLPACPWCARPLPGLRHRTGPNASPSRAGAFSFLTNSPPPRPRCRPPCCGLCSKKPLATSGFPHKCGSLPPLTRPALPPTAGTWPRRWPTGSFICNGSPPPPISPPGLSVGFPGLPASKPSRQMRRKSPRRKHISARFCGFGPSLSRSSPTPRIGRARHGPHPALGRWQPLRWLLAGLMVPGRTSSLPCSSGRWGKPPGSKPCPG